MRTAPTAHLSLTVSTRTRWLACLSLAAVIASGHSLNGQDRSTTTEAANRPRLILRTVSLRSRQPRPMTAPIIHLNEHADSAVKLLGIETDEIPSNLNSLALPPR